MREKKDLKKEERGRHKDRVKRDVMMEKRVDFLKWSISIQAAPCYPTHASPSCPVSPAVISRPVADSQSFESTSKTLASMEIYL